MSPMNFGIWVYFTEYLMIYSAREEESVLLEFYIGTGFYLKNTF
jgi:hypothetical protein